MTEHLVDRPRRVTGRRPVARKPRSGAWHAPVGLLLAATSLACAYLSTIGPSLTLGVLAVFLAGGASLLVIGSSGAARRSGMFLPATFVGIWLLGFGGASLAWSNPSDLIDPQIQGLRSSSVPMGLAIAAVGLQAWALGYITLNLRIIQAAVAGARRWSTTASNAYMEYELWRVLAVYSVGLSARLLQLWSGQFSYITSDLEGATTQSSPTGALLSHLGFLTTAGILVLAYGAFLSGSSRWVAALTFVLFVEIPFGLLSGMRSFLLLRFLSVAVTFVLVRGRVPKSAVAGLVLTLVFLSPFIDAYRAEVRGSRGTTVDAEGALDLIPTLAGKTVSEISFRDLHSAPADFVTKRLRWVDEVAIVAQRSPSEIPHVRTSDSILEASTAMIPRALWPGKPVYAEGLEYARTFWGQPDHVISSRSPTLPGDSYFRGGWAGVVVIMALVGGLMAALGTALNPHRHPAATPLFLAVWLGVMNVEGSLVLLAAGLTQTVLMMALILRWTSQGSRRRRMARVGTRIIGHGSPVS